MRFRLDSISPRYGDYLVTDLQPFCTGWTRFTEDMYEQLYGPPRPSLT